MIFRKDLYYNKIHSHRLIQENNVIRVRNVKCTHIVVMGPFFHRLQLIIKCFVRNKKLVFSILSQFPQSFITIYRVQYSSCGHINIKNVN